MAFQAPPQGLPAGTDPGSAGHRIWTVLAAGRDSAGRFCRPHGPEAGASAAARTQITRPRTIPRDPRTERRRPGLTATPPSTGRRTAMEDQILIEARGLSRRFGPTVAVAGLDLTLKKGEILGMLGPNGAGKTTTMKMLAGCLAPSDGSSRIN